MSVTVLYLGGGHFFSGYSVVTNAVQCSTEYIYMNRYGSTAINYKATCYGKNVVFLSYLNCGITNRIQKCLQLLGRRSFRSLLNANGINEQITSDILLVFHANAV